jgi:putative flippase GtrA
LQSLAPSELVHDPHNAGTQTKSPGWLLELVGYGFASAAALVADTLILRFLVQTVHWNYVPASAVAFTSGAALAYFLSIRFVFRSHQVANRALEFGYFLGLGVVGLLVNTAVLSLTFGLMGLGLIESKGLAALCTFTTNFVLRRWLLFSSSGKGQ